MDGEISRKKQTVVFSWELFFAVVVNVVAFVYFATMSQAAQDVRIAGTEKDVERLDKTLDALTAQQTAITNLTVAVAQMQTQITGLKDDVNQLKR